MTTSRETNLLYEKAFALIKANIQDGVWLPGEKIPSERELCNLFGMSRITIRKAIEMSEQANLVRRVRGSGTYVIDKKYNQSLKKIVSFEKTLATLGTAGSTRIYEVKRNPADLLMGSILHASHDEAILNLKLIGEADGSPVVFYDSYFAEDIGQEIVRLAQIAESEKKPFSTVELQHIRVQEQPLRIKQTFEAITADESLCTILNIASYHPIMKITSIIYASEQAVEYRLAYYLGDKYKFSTDRTLYGRIS